MSRAGEKLLSKVIDSNDPQALKRFNVKDKHFTTEAERKACRFISEYAESNGGNAPDYRTLVEETGLNYEPNVGDTYDYLVREVKEFSLGVALFEMLQKEGGQKFKSMKKPEFAKWLRDQTEGLLLEHDTRTAIGANIKTDVDGFLEEYRKRKAGESFKIWRSFFKSVNEAIGGYAGGGMYTWYGRSGRGKSQITLAECVFSAIEGATVLIWAMEMSRYEIMARIYSFISAYQNSFKTKIDGVEYGAGFSNRALLTGELPEKYEKGFEHFLRNINEYIGGSIIIRGVDDEDFNSRSIRDLEADILATKADVVLIDPFYYLDYETNFEKVTGGGATSTSKAIRKLAGRTKTVIHVITQAEETEDERSKTGIRQLRAPRRNEVKKTKAVLEDATTLIGIDSLDGNAVIEINKGRNGGEGETIDLVFVPNFGIIREMPSGDEVQDQFKDDF